MALSTAPEPAAEGRMRYDLLLILMAAGTFGGGVLAADGRAVYTRSCAACHGLGTAGAPRLDDRLAWAQRVRSGQASLLWSVLKGKGAMPPKGGNANLSDAEVAAALEYMMSVVQ